LKLSKISLVAFMLAVFTSPLELVTAADVAELPAQTWPEGYEVEFKKTLPHRTAGAEPWLAGQGGRIGDYARNKILAEVIAFANSQGGSVFLGIAETSDNPPRAQAVTPLPRVGDLAQRFEDQARSCIEPPLPRLRIRAIETDGQEGGVVVFRVPASRTAPHRLTTTRESYVRRGSSTEKMTMREIQDMTLNVVRGLAGIDARFANRRSAFEGWVETELHAVAYRVTALPLIDLPDPGRLFGKQGIFPGKRDFKATVGNKAVDLEMPIIGGYDERPCLRGISRSGRRIAGAFNWELHQNGLVDFWISVRPWRAPGAPLQLDVHHSEILAAVANSLAIVEHYREYVGTPDAEYGIEIQLYEFKDVIRRTADVIQLGKYSVLYSGFFAEAGLDSHAVRGILLPRYSVGAHHEFADLLSAVDIDLYDALGVRRIAPPLLRVTI
jgi:hypothetical protein